MRRISTLWKPVLFAFISSFCVIVIELVAGRMLAPYIGVSLYTWTSIIGIIMTGIALGNYIGGKIADRYPSPLVLMAVFFAGGLATIAILPATKMVTSNNWFGNLPVMLDFTLKTSLIFLLPAIILSMVSPMVIKLALADLKQTGGIVGSIYACSTLGSIVGTFMTGFYFILWFGTRGTIWLIASVLILTGIIAWFSWRIPRWSLSSKNFIIWMTIIGVVLSFVFLFQRREYWQETYTKESNYFAIQVESVSGDWKALRLDHLYQSYIIPDNPTVFVYEYLNIFKEIVKYIVRENAAPGVLHLGGGAYSFPRYMVALYPESVNEVVEIDPLVTQVAHEELGLPLETSIKTYNQDARSFLTNRKAESKYDIVIGDVFNDHATPYHLTTLEFDKLVKANMNDDGIYLVNIIDNYKYGRYMPSFVHTLRQAFEYVYLFAEGGISEEMGEAGNITFVIAATDRPIDVTEFQAYISEGGKRRAVAQILDAAWLESYWPRREPILLTDDYAPTDILVAPLFGSVSDTLPRF